MTVTSSGSNRSNKVTERQTPQRAAIRAGVNLIEKVDLRHLPPGMNPELAQKVRNIGLTTDPKLQPTKNPTVTHCNQAADKYAVQFGYKGFQDRHGNPMLANDMFAKMNAPGSGWKKVSAADAIAAAANGKLVFAAVSAAGHGHIAAVTGEWSPGVPGISQAGSPPNFEFGKWRRQEPAQYFVRE